MNWWDYDRRYDLRVILTERASEFLAEADIVVTWVRERVWSWPPPARRTSRHVRRILEVLESGYGPSHPRARFDVDQVNRWTIRIRVVEPGIASLGPTERDTPIWDALQALPDDTFQMISLLFVLAPGELKDSPTNRMFEDERDARLRRRLARSAAAGRRRGRQ